MEDPCIRRNDKEKKWNDKEKKVGITPSGLVIPDVAPAKFRNMYLFQPSEGKETFGRMVKKQLQILQ